MAHLDPVTKLASAYKNCESDDDRADIVKEFMRMAKNQHNPLQQAFSQGFLENIHKGWFISSCDLPRGASICPDPLMDGAHDWHRNLYIVSAHDKIVIYGPGRSFKLVIDPLPSQTAKLTLRMNVPPTFNSYLEQLAHIRGTPLTHEEVAAMNALPGELKDTLQKSAKRDLATNTTEMEFRCSSAVSEKTVLVQGIDQQEFRLLLVQTR